MNKIKMVLAGAVAMASFGLMTAPTYAAVTCPAGSKNATAENIAQCNMEETTNTLMGTITTIINVILGLIGLIAVIMIIMGGLNYTMSNGDAGKVKKAKDTILYSVIGLVIALLAYAIVNFVLVSLFTSSSTNNNNNNSNPTPTPSTTSYVETVEVA